MEFESKLPRVDCRDYVGTITGVIANGHNAPRSALSDKTEYVQRETTVLFGPCKYWQFCKNYEEIKCRSKLED